MPEAMQVCGIRALPVFAVRLPRYARVYARNLEAHVSPSHHSA